jgi:hypothetical protein
VFILCLGATVELDLERCGIPEGTTVVNTEDNLPVVDPEAVEEEAGQKTKGKKPRKSQKNTSPQTGAESKVEPKGKREKGKEKATVAPPRPKPSAATHERLKISMVHGDVLILSGGDFIVSCFFRPPPPR